ncbi:MAG: molybdenum cofactor biosynthesis protein MoaB [Cyanobacteria bacterium]|nr:molybdenum cofactor biosynthesis protein MoaB [Cyanobacteria bacterium CG_2015-16_32_12]NCO78168.1 molybdenum cofactor biosynthesis protein MoaB [Cyanobacteria bacterium CG_2015-22_32_23]NCQ04611.1 molybdenum cofactor biosynthesis protein MoaB [Cyanobacteria bacterium CG_2015-09_32_10]NCQ43138.1 molybdenum cofactor biosynthesis protein MoaB [Cyanobacteria bacterium CG_2015-04_32_10]NCS84159.1 molybdenum cofactor biosynthesis protein MoaB [Cyanobacteria bacterium CG_2015-02_32_10]
MPIPHQYSQINSVNCAVITVSDTRTFETDMSGKIAQKMLINANHKIIHYEIIKDESFQIKSLLINLASNKALNVIIFSGGTGISLRDNTYDIISEMLEKTLYGFGEIFRYLSYQEIASRAIASRATAGLYNGKIVFSLPGSQNAVKLGLEKLIIPELTHLVEQINKG